MNAPHAFDANISFVARRERPYEFKHHLSDGHMSLISQQKMVAALFVLGLAAQADAQTSRLASMDPRPEHETIQASRVNTRVLIDGRLTEAAWRAARPVTQFVQQEPSAGMPATRATDVRMLVTDDAVIIGARLTDDRSALFSRDTSFGNHDVVKGYLADFFEVQIDPHHGHATALAFNVTPTGSRRASLVMTSGDRDESWDIHWESATHIDANGWTAEIRIPLSEFHVKPGDESWGVQFVRFSWQRQETDVFRYVSRAATSALDSNR